MTTNLETTSRLAKVGFEPAPTTSPPRRLVACLSGLEKTGKTHLALTAPEPIYYISVDIGTEGVMEKFTQAGKEIYIHRLRMQMFQPLPSGAAGAEQQRRDFTPVWEDLQVAFTGALLEGQGGTVIVDTASEALEIARLAHFGKLTQVSPQHQQEVNAEWRELIRQSYNSRMSVIFIHRVREKFEQPGVYEIRQLPSMAYEVQINITTGYGYEMREREEVPGTYRIQRIQEDPKLFHAYIKDCRQNMGVAGQSLSSPSPGAHVDFFSFENLLSMVHGG